MSTTPVRPTHQEVRARAEEIQKKILSRFSDVDVEIALWEDLNGDNASHWHHRGFPMFLQYDVHACLLIRGNADRTEAAAVVADGDVAHLLGETNIVIQIQRTNRVYCRNSQPLIAYSVQPGVPIKATPTKVISDPRGILFICMTNEANAHNWGRLSPHTQ
ncbi:MAG: hypothetical protein EXR50_04105 [Dehalococcoidia bacterium]|nr:hypothetical protein [Dehalococcoidia bacterium]